jgi:uncharacterized protein
MMSSVYLLDANVLIALADVNHSLHDRADKWFRPDVQFATCPITQGALIRYYLRVSNATVGMAKDFLAGFVAMPTHEFWVDDVSFVAIPEQGVTGHRQVTDAYLVALAKRNHGMLATMDEGIAAIHSNAFLLPHS